MSRVVFSCPGCDADCLIIGGVKGGKTGIWAHKVPACATWTRDVVEAMSVPGYDPDVNGTNATLDEVRRRYQAAKRTTS